MEVALLMCCSCSLLASSGLGGAFAGGLIPNTGPHVEKESGIKELKTYIPLVDELMDKVKDLHEDDMQPVIDAFIAEKAPDLCKDLDTFGQYTEKVEGDIFTLSGAKPMEEFTVDYFGGEENAMKITKLRGVTKCPGTSE